MRKAMRTVVTMLLVTVILGAQARAINPASFMLLYSAGHAMHAARDGSLDAEASSGEDAPEQSTDGIADGEASENPSSSDAQEQPEQPAQSEEDQPEQDAEEQPAQSEEDQPEQDAEEQPAQSEEDQPEQDAEEQPAQSEEENPPNTADNGLAGVALVLETAETSPGAPLYVTARFDGLEEEKICRAQWFLNGEALPGYRNEQLALAPQSVSTFERELVYTPAMPLSYTVGFYVTYPNPQTGIEERLGETITLTMQNHDAAHYKQHVMNKISATYQEGLADYQPWEKEAFVNYQGYSSRTDYLVWVNEATQKVNIFTGKQGEWKLQKSFPCAMGLPRTKTPVGVTYVTAKQTGWYMASYTCKNVVRFYPGTGYAFHSQPLYSGTNTAKETAMSKPASHGCVRMLLDDSAWLHQNIPLKTTVAIF